MNELIIFTDGGARGNPGPAACAFVALKGSKQIHKDSKYLGVATNNSAEYQGVILAFKWLLSSLFTVHRSLITINMDSLLVVNQLNGVYKIKNPDLQMLHAKVKELEDKLKTKIFYKHVPREKNQLADALVNENLNKNA